MLYIVAGMTIGIKQARKHQLLALAFAMPFTFLILHLSYGIGFLQGLVVFYALRSSNAVEKNTKSSR